MTSKEPSNEDKKFLINAAQTKIKHEVDIATLWGTIGTLFLLVATITSTQFIHIQQASQITPENILIYAPLLQKMLDLQQNIHSITIFFTVILTLTVAMIYFAIERNLSRAREYEKKVYNYLQNWYPQSEVKDLIKIFEKH